jgi:RND family efflux transporter MFP subunit
VDTKDVAKNPPVTTRARGTVPGAVRASRSAVVLGLQARALGQDRYHASATAVVTELARLLRCERVSIGFHQHGRTRVGAISSGADIRSQQDVVRAIGAAMDEAIDQRSIVVHPLPLNSSPSVSLAHAGLSKANGHLAICTVPIVIRRRAHGAIVLERREGFDAQAVETAKDAAGFVGPVLELKFRLDQSVGGRIVEAVAPRGKRAGAPRPGVGGAVAGALSIAAIVLALWPTTLRVVAPARVEGVGQRVIAAPVDGFVQAVSLRPGEAVKAGQVLVTLEDRDLALERAKWTAEASQLDKQYREALTKDDAAQIVIARSKLEQAQAQLDLVALQIERAQLKAPFDGVLISGDLSQSVGMPVKRGQELMTVAPDKSFRIVAEVDEQDIGQLRTGQRARVMFAALVERPMTMALTRVAPVATPLEGRNVFEVDGRLEGSDQALRHGLRGVVRIEIEDSTYGAVWWQRASQWLQRTSWRLLG